MVQLIMPKKLFTRVQGYRAQFALPIHLILLTKIRATSRQVPTKLGVDAKRTYRSADRQDKFTYSINFFLRALEQTYTSSIVIFCTKVVLTL